MLQHHFTAFPTARNFSSHAVHKHSLALRSQNWLMMAVALVLTHTVCIALSLLQALDLLSLRSVVCGELRYRLHITDKVSISTLLSLHLRVASSYACIEIGNAAMAPPGGQCAPLDVARQPGN